MSKIVREWIESRGLTQDQFAKEIGWSKTFLNGVLMGHYSDISYLRLRSLSDLLGYGVDLLAEDLLKLEPREPEPEPEQKVEGEEPEERLDPNYIPEGYVLKDIE